MVPLLSDGQSVKGISFDGKFKSWNEVLEKAKTENKYVFVDCFASWCKPCFWMEKEVFSKGEVGEIMNKNFICVRLQLDSVNGNQAFNGLQGSEFIAKQFQVNEFPTFLFFKPGGEIAHKSVGAKPMKDFLSLVNSALDSNKQFYSLLRRFERGYLNYKHSAYLANTAKLLKEKEIAKKVAWDYINNYLLKLKQPELFTKENILFIASNIDNTTGEDFKLFYKHGKIIDDVVSQKGYSQDVVDFVITKEFINPILKDAINRKQNNIKFERVSNILRKRFSDEYSQRNVLNAKIRWYQYRNDWQNLAKNYIKKIDKFGPDTSDIGIMFFNNMIWEVFFEHIDDTAQLNKSIGWVQYLASLKPTEPIILDTYANLLYKVGRVNEAIHIEKRALMLEEAKAIKDIRAVPNKIYQETLEKMNRGEPTWIIDKGM